jgi:hypothetical protein
MLYQFAVAVPLALLGFVISTGAESAQASSKFYCSSSGGAPATMTTTRSGKQVPIILWKSSVFSADGWSPERRCGEVSQRFNNLHQTGSLKYLTTGRMNGMPVICAARSEGTGCVEGGLLYTLKPGQNASQTLRNLLAIRVKATGPLTETTSRPYFSLTSIEEAAESNASLDGAASPSVTVSEGSARPAVPSGPAIRSLPAETTTTSSPSESLW